MLEGRWKRTRGKRQVDYVMERKDSCSGDGNQESGGTGIKGAGRERLEEDSSMLISVSGTCEMEARMEEWEGGKLGGQGGGRVTARSEWMVSTLWWKKRGKVLS